MTMASRNPLAPFLQPAGLVNIRPVIRPLSLLLAACSILSCGSSRTAVFQNPSREARFFGAGDQTLTYVVIGDSTAAGQGADYEQGIAVATARALIAPGRRVSMTNLAVSGATMGDVARDQLQQAERLHPDVVLLSAAANDVTHLTWTSSVRHSLLEIIDGLRSANPRTAIVVTGSPDMGAPPRIPALLRPLASLRTKRVNRMVRSVAADRHLIFAPIAEGTGEQFRADHTLFADDRFHPNERGYATWIAVLNPAMAKTGP